MNKRLLTVTYYFPPLGGVGVQRISKFCKYLPEFGYDPVVVAPRPASFYMHDEDMLAEVKHVELHRVEGRDSFRMREKIAGQRKPRIDSTVRKIARAFVWPDFHRGFMSAAFNTVRCILYKVDVIFITAPPWSNLLLVPKVKGICNQPIIIDMRDPWVGHPEHDNRIKQMRNRRAERVAIESADAVIAATRAHAADFKKRYPRFASCIHYIPNGFDMEDFPKRKPRKKRPSDTEPLIMSYAGILGLVGINNGSTLYCALRRLKEGRNLTPSELVLEITGSVTRREERRIRESGVKEYIKLLGHVSHKKAMARLASADLAWLPYQSGYSSAIVPAKTYEYIGSGVPVLAEVSRTHETARLIEETGTGMIIGEGDVDGTVSALELLLEDRYPYKPKKRVIEKFNRRNQAQKLAGTIDGLINDR